MSREEKAKNSRAILNLLINTCVRKFEKKWASGKGKQSALMFVRAGSATSSAEAGGEVSKTRFFEKGKKLSVPERMGGRGEGGGP